VDFRKLAGILVETVGEIQGPSVAVIGVGVNYRLPERVVDLIDQPVIDVAQCTRNPPTRSALLGRLAAHLARALADFDRRGFAGARDAWRGLHAYQGDQFFLMMKNKAPFDAKVVDVAPDGALIVATKAGPLQLASAEISLRGR